MISRLPHQSKLPDQLAPLRKPHHATSPLSQPATELDPAVKIIAKKLPTPNDTIVWDAGKESFYLYTEESGLAEKLYDQIGRCGVYYQKGRSFGWQFLMTGRVLNILQKKLLFNIQVEDKNSSNSGIDSKQVTRLPNAKSVTRSANSMSGILGDDFSINESHSEKVAVSSTPGI